jgi:hypothetical protein
VEQVGVWPVLKLAARAALWRTTPDPRPIGVPALLGWIVVLALARMAFQLVEAGSAPNFNLYGLDAVVAWLAIEIAIAALIVPTAGRITALAAMVALTAMPEIVVTVVSAGSRLPGLPAAVQILSDSTAAAGAWLAIQTVWWLGAMVAVLEGLGARGRFRLAGRVAALWIALAVAYALVPHVPVFLAADYDMRNVNMWELLRARSSDDGSPHALRIDVAEAAQSQSALLQAQISRLAPQRQGVTDIYTIAVAGWAEQDVFAKELGGALASIGAVLPIKDRIVRLINNRQTVGTVPLADHRNFAAAVHAVGVVMDKNEDILLLFMTSHGNDHGFGLQLPGRGPTELTPAELAATLDKEGIKNRVVIVSACFSGIFLPPLKNDDSIVLTAADARSTSFGCAPGRDWTYFGDALFRQGLQPGTDFEHAFEHARILIHGWELMDGMAPSNPQAHFGPALVAKLKPLFEAERNAEH